MWFNLTILVSIILTSTIGALISAKGVNSWYKTLSLPSWTPSGTVIGIVWTIIFLMLAAAMLIVSPIIRQLDTSNTLLLVIFYLSCLLNIYWCFLFFASHKMILAIYESVLLSLSVLCLAILLYPVSAESSFLLLPYFFWVCFATKLSYSVWELNPWTFSNCWLYS